MGYFVDTLNRGINGCSKYCSSILSSSSKQPHSTSISKNSNLSLRDLESKKNYFEGFREEFELKSLQYEALKRSFSTEKKKKSIQEEKITGQNDHCRYDLTASLPLKSPSSPRVVASRMSPRLPSHRIVPVACTFPLVLHRHQPPSPRVVASPPSRLHFSPRLASSQPPSPHVVASRPRRLHFSQRQLSSPTAVASRRTQLPPRSKMVLFQLHSSYTKW
ncbi:hypothetical protein PIB30_086201, partial [Stylosanthes scabra]|nr:hypothetical protein [Stylosanthes scabra]